ncbi:hypothetical protein RFM68_29205 [Mesorhizobium sp. MSK_1335]|uniref:Uncharacterized protein n=1 Tax=Mesorhizobium montanum TaxID=3072323 RepID=A0ABU4ZU75_9HYPH|nr:hypothetical protein [Mesorhizobium sp. MSK_1335]MDX8528562.1 hypothetical protein [Mesorhizobium sp. MSK_1335]
MVAVGRGEDIAADARKIGAYRYIDANKENAADVLNGMGGAKAIRATSGNSAAIAAPMHALAPGGV